MPPCHVDRYLTAAGARALPDSTTSAIDGNTFGETEQETQACDAPSVDSCDYCGSARLEWRKCKLVCADCRQINKSCADL